MCDLLSHRTGLPRHDLAFWRLRHVQRAEFIHRVRHFSLSASFREKFQYCNLLYNVAAYLVEKLAGQRWEEFVAQRIFQPLAMTQSTLEPDFEMEDGTVAEGYRLRQGGEGNPFEHVRYDQRSELSPGAAGALFSTLDDMGQWLKVQLGAGCCDGVQLITPENLKPMHSPQTIIPVDAVGHALTGTTMLAYGMGWRMRPYGGGTLIDHGGNTMGHSVVVGFMPETQIGVVVLSNAAFSDVPHVLLRAAVDHALKLPNKDWNARFHAVMDPLLQPKNSSPIKPQPKAPLRPLLQYEGRYTACGYPEFQVMLEQGQLHACTEGSLP